jgi:hypothetical protein
MMRAASYLPDIMKNVAIAARGERSVCAKCGGEGTVSGSTCRDCCGLGEFRILGDLRAVRLIFEIFELIGTNRRRYV